MMTQKTTVLALLAGAGLFSLSLATGAWAADVNKLVENCVNCHGKDGASAKSDVPNIGGFSAPYLGDSMTAYKQKERPCPDTKIMCIVAKDLSDGDVKEMAKYFAGKKFVRAKQKFDPALAVKGKKIHENDCEKCHSEGGSLASDDAGILAGQWMPYLKQELKAFKTGTRPMVKKMKPKIEKLQQADIDALVNYYGSFK